MSTHTQAHKRFERASRPNMAETNAARLHGGVETLFANHFRPKSVGQNECSRAKRKQSLNQVTNCSICKRASATNGSGSSAANQMGFVAIGLRRHNRKVCECFDNKSAPNAWPTRSTCAQSDRIGLERICRSLPEIGCRRRQRPLTSTRSSEHDCDRRRRSRRRRGSHAPSTATTMRASKLVACCELSLSLSMRRGSSRRLV